METRQQSKSVLLLRFRASRITASKLKAACMTNLLKPSGTLIKRKKLMMQFKWRTSPSNAETMEDVADTVRKSSHGLTKYHHIRITSSHQGTVWEYVDNPEVAIDIAWSQSKAASNSEMPYLATYIPLWSDSSNSLSSSSSRSGHLNPCEHAQRKL
ncbi:hypothetical protein MAR_031990 [Mya arenaria]|uniref:Uncharacterized protein n=1 Tax=Mya arenaria TaxID=6604 RepID=A0ABY7FDQ4_MYAAR|nr:hypothetical protein MAR_031990 [Mya arenaria]